MLVKNVENKEKSTAEIVVEISKEEFEKAVQAAYLKNKNKIQVPGFRKGKAPRTLIEKMFGKSVFHDDAIDTLCQPAYEYAVEEKKLNVVGRPAVTDAKVADDLTATLTFVVGLYPEVKLGTYKGVEAERETVKISAADVNKEIDAVRNRNARIETVTRAAKKGDTVMIDFEGFVDGVAFEGGAGSDHALELGSGQFVPGFEDQLIGVKAGENKDVNVTFPTEYVENLAGKDATFKVTVKEVKEKILPELDDDFAKDVSEFDTFEEYKKDVSKKLKERRETAADNEFYNNAVEEVINGMTVEIPDQMVEAQAENMMNEYEYRLQSQGITLDQYCQMMGMDRVSLAKVMQPEALHQVKRQLALQAVAKAENFEVTEDDLNKEYEKLADEYGMDTDKVKQFVTDAYLEEDIKAEKAMNFIKETAVKVAKKAEKKADAAEEKKPAAKKSTAKKATEEKAETEKKPAAKKATAEKKPATEKKPAAKKTTKKASETK